MSHDHSHQNSSEKNLKTAFYLNLVFSIAELIGGMSINSVAILADALHDFGDSISLAISWRMEHLAKKGEDATFSYGYRRFSLLSAFISASILIGGGVIILSQAIPRLANPIKPDTNGMLGFAILGILINGIAVLRTRAGKTMNEKMVSWHLLEDVFGWVVVLITALVIKIRPVYILDPLLSIGITIYVLIHVIKNLRSTVLLFLQSVPEKVDVKKIENAILKEKNVKGIHHTHAWSLDGEKHVLTTHVLLEACAKKEDIRAVKSLIKGFTQEYDLAHTTIEFEYSDEDCSMTNHSADHEHV